MNKIKVTSRQYLKMFNLLLIGLIVGQIGFAVGVLMMHLNGEPTNPTFPIAVAYGICGMLLASGLGAGKVIFEKKIQAAREQTSLADQLQSYRAAAIIRFALLEMPGIASIVFYLLTQEEFLLCFCAASIISMFAFRPTLPKLIQDLQLDFKSQQLLEDPNAVLYEVERSLDND